MWRMAKGSNMTKMLRDSIRTKKNLLKEKRSAFNARVDAIKTEIKSKKEILRQHKRRVASDPGTAPSRDMQKSHFKLYNNLIRTTEREIKALEKDLDMTKKEKDAEIKAIESEIKALEANIKIYS